MLLSKPVILAWRQKYVQPQKDYKLHNIKHWSKWLKKSYLSFSQCSLFQLKKSLHLVQFEVLMVVSLLIKVLVGYDVVLLSSQFQISRDFGATLKHPGLFDCEDNSNIRTTCPATQNLIPAYWYHCILLALQQNFSGCDLWARGTNTAETWFIRRTK